MSNTDGSSLLIRRRCYADRYGPRLSAATSQPVRRCRLAIEGTHRRCRPKGPKFLPEFEAEAPVERMRFRERSLEITRQTFSIRPLEHRLEQPPPDTATLSRRLHANESQVPMRLGRVVFRQGRETVEQRLKSLRV